MVAQATLNKAHEQAMRVARDGRNVTRVGKHNLRETMTLPTAAWVNVNQKFGPDAHKDPGFREYATRKHPYLKVHDLADRLTVGYRGEARGPSDSVRARFGKGRTVAAIVNGQFVRVP